MFLPTNGWWLKNLSETHEFASSDYLNGKINFMFQSTKQIISPMNFPSPVHVQRHAVAAPCATCKRCDEDSDDAEHSVCQGLA